MNEKNIKITNDIRVNTNYRYRELYKFSLLSFKRYDWKTSGVLRNIAPGFLMRTNNRVLNNIMRFIDMWAVTFLIGCDKVKNFKNIFDK